MKSYDIVIIGGGPGGYTAAVKGARMGAKIAVVEKHKLGGVCYNYGCIPTKTLLKNAKLYEEILSSDKFGINLKGEIIVDWHKMMERKDNVVNEITNSVRDLLLKNGVDIYNCFGQVIDKNTIKVEDEQIKTKNLIIATGSSVKFPPIEGLKEAYNSGHVLDSTGAITLEKLPKDMIILGAGVIGIEFATLYASLGVNITLVQRSGELLSHLDKEISEEIKMHLKKKSVNILLNASTTKVKGKAIEINIDGKTKEISAECIVACLGRTYNIKGLESLDLNIGKRGIEVDNKMRTNIENVYAIGDVNGDIMLAHVASAEGVVAVENILGKESTMNYDNIPANIYSSPEVGTIGISEEGAIKKGLDIVTSKLYLHLNGKALAEGDNAGFVKIVANKENGEILGVHIISAHAADMIPEAAAVMSMKGTIHDLAKTIHPHPTMSEIIMEAAYDVLEKIER
jgi:dihydrolipoamide dehydrogenase